jgi:hypothetical protein
MQAKDDNEVIKINTSSNRMYDKIYNSLISINKNQFDKNLIVILKNLSKQDVDDVILPADIIKKLYDVKKGGNLYEHKFNKYNQKIQHITDEFS